jgi:hypothetical protein
MITEQDIEEDIKSFEQRLRLAREKLAALSIDTNLTYKLHRKRSIQRQKLLNEITHVERLLHYAREGLTDFGGHQEFID